jgi:hypothetical protein
LTSQQLEANASSPQSACSPDTNVNSVKNADIAPKLEEFIPKEYFPEVLLVDDSRNLTVCNEYNDNANIPLQIAPRIYRRVFPKSDGSTESDKLFVTDPISSCISIAADSNVNTAHLNLASATSLGVGSHSKVYRSSLRLPEALVSTEVTVAAKLAFHNEESRQMLFNEGKIYDAFPPHLMEDWTGFNLLPADLRHHIDGFIVPCTAVVPKFYGYYEPVGPTPTVDTTCKKRSAILLIEECGIPIVPRKLDGTMRFVAIFCHLYHLLPHPQFSRTGTNAIVCHFDFIMRSSSKTLSTHAMSSCNPGR